jgi:hypothetical protein
VHLSSHSSSGLGASLLAAAALLSCGKLLGIESAERSSADPEGGRSGAEEMKAGDAATVAGEAAGAVAGAIAAEGGVRNEEGIAGGVGDGAPAAPDVGESCKDEEVKACSSADPRRLLQCADGVWETLATCRNAERCDPEPQQCRPLAAHCQEHPEGFCDVDSLIDCAANPFAPPDRKCPFGCSSGACLTGIGDRFIVHTELHTGGAMPWPDAPIPVCFASGDTPESLRQWTRSSVEQGWRRYLDLEFSGWQSCESAETPGVVVEFLEDCRARIAGAVSLGYPGPGKQVRVGICRSYHDDAGGGPRDLEEHHVRFVALHQFGHVLGLEESDGTVGSVMIRGIRWTVEPMVWADDILELASHFGYKPEASIVHVSGWCLDTAGGRVALARCSASGTQRFRPFPNRVELEGSSDCLAAAEGDAVAVLDCSAPPSNALVLRRARWSAPGHCVAPRALPVIPGTPLETTTCSELGDVSQTWSFEIAASVEGRPQARIRFPAQDYCVAAPQDFSGPGDVPTLEPCSSTPTLFELGPDGRVSLRNPGTGDRFCLRSFEKDSALFFDSSCGRPFMLTGSLETADGRALEVDPDNPGGELSLRDPGPVGLPPTLGQVFDVPF